MQTIKTIGSKWLQSNKATLAAMASAVALAVYQGLDTGHFSWRSVALAALAVLCGLGRSTTKAGQ